MISILRMAEARIKELQTLFPSPIQPICRPSRAWKFWLMVWRSANIWSGCSQSDRALITGTLACSASWSTVP